MNRKFFTRKRENNVHAHLGSYFLIIIFRWLKKIDSIGKGRLADIVIHHLFYFLLVNTPAEVSYFLFCIKTQDRILIYYILWQKVIS